MCPQNSSVRICYKSADIQPPLFIAGSYSDPQWTPQEMEHSKTASGEHVYTKTVKGSPGSTFEYKFRVGTGDWWILDESVPTATDNMGNKNNVMKLSDQQSVHIERPPTPPPDSPSPPRILGLDGLEIGPRFSHENFGSADADVDADADADADSNPGMAPMFAYEFAGSQAPSEAALSYVSSYASDEPRDEDFDPNDPTLERFPSNRDEILEKVRTIESGLNEDRASFDGVPLSPVVGPGRRHSIEPGVDMLSVSPATGDPGMAQPDGRPDFQKVSRSRESLRPSMSGIPLHCIVEESAVEGPAIQDEHTISLPESVVLKPDAYVPADSAVLDPGDSAEATAQESKPSRSQHESRSEDREVAPETTTVAGNATSPSVGASSHEDNEQAVNGAQLVHIPATGLTASKTGNWFTSFLKLVFVDWMGAFFSKVFSWRRS